VHEARVAGYYYLIASTRLPDAVSAEARQKFGRVNEAPCVYLGMIGVSRDYKGNGIGKLLMADAMAKTLQVADLIGIYALVLDALDDKVAQFYESLGFMRFVDGERKMFIPLQTIKNALSAT